MRAGGEAAGSAGSATSPGSTCADAAREPERRLLGTHLCCRGQTRRSSCLAVPFCWLMARDLWGLLTQARADPSRVTGFLPAADQLVFGDAVLGEKARRVVVLDRVGQHPVSLLGQFWQRRYPQDANHVLSCDLHRSRTFRLGAPAGARRAGARCPGALGRLGRRRVTAGVRAVFQGFDGAEKGAEAGFVAQVIGVGRPLVGRFAVGLLVRLAGLVQGQLCPDVEFEFMQERAVAGRCAHRAASRIMCAVASGWATVTACEGSLSASWVTGRCVAAMRAACRAGASAANWAWKRLA